MHIVERDTLIRMMGRMSVLTILGLSGLQVFLSAGFDNIISVLVIVATSLLTICYCFSGERLWHYPFSIMIILGNSFLTLVGALVLQSLYLNPVSLDLQSPVFTFSILGVFQVLLIGAHFFYSKANKEVDQIRPGLTSIWRRLHLYDMPSPNQLLILGFIGCVASIISKKDGFGAWGGVGMKFLDGFVFLCYAPLLVIIPNGRTVFSLKYLYLILYFIVIFGLGVVSNSRGFFAMYPMMGAVLFFIAIAVGLIPLTRKIIIVSCSAVILLVLGLIPFTNLAIAMEVARGQRATMSYSELMKETFDLSLNREILNGYLEKADSQKDLSDDYNEAYIPNRFLNRLVVVKYQDNMLSVAGRVRSESRGDVNDVTISKILCLLPDPLLTRLAPQVNKLYYAEFSVGDYIQNMAGSKVLGGFKLGSMLAHAYVLFGHFMWLLLFFPLIIVFFICDSFMYRGVDGEARFMVVGLLLSWTIVSFYTYDSFINPLAFFVRGLPQAVLIYLLCDFVVLRLFKSRRA